MHQSRDPFDMARIEVSRSGKLFFRDIIFQLLLFGKFIIQQFYFGGVCSGGCSAGVSFGTSGGFSSGGWW